MCKPFNRQQNPGCWARDRSATFKLIGYRDEEKNGQESERRQRRDLGSTWWVESVLSGLSSQTFPHPIRVSGMHRKICPQRCCSSARSTQIFTWVFLWDFVVLEEESEAWEMVVKLWVLLKLGGNSGKFGEFGVLAVTATKLQQLWKTWCEK